MIRYVIATRAATETFMNGLRVVLEWKNRKTCLRTSYQAGESSAQRSQACLGIVCDENRNEGKFGTAMICDQDHNH